MSEVPDIPDDPSGSITVLYHQWRQGDSASLNQLIARFRPRLLALAHSTLRGRIQRMADAEDALQSAMISFWEGVADGDFNNNMDREDLWNVLGLITVRKATKLQERELAQKRGSGQVVTGVSLDQAQQPQQPLEGMDLICEELLQMLDPDLRAFALLRLMGHKNREIADELGCTERKVERKLQLIRAEWENEVGLWNA
ncbi:MAG: hypothetical protein JSS49_26605 [Planctomycetes bacterium]|nr:hypothetical protein [Planctomycetota bacterium]